MNRLVINKQAGFTLVELIVVIVILGILAATALPKFINVSSDARAAALQGLVGAINSASSLAQAKYVATGNTIATTVAMGPTGGTSVAVASGTGFPTIAGIQAAVDLTGLDPNPTALTDIATRITFKPKGGTFTSATEGCFVVYDPATGVASLPTTITC